jgi:hypothetical protein
MTPSWYYQQSGNTHGPVSAEEMKRLVREGRLHAHDLVWEEGTGPDQAVPADAALDFSAVTQATGPLPAWLADVELPDCKGPIPGLAATAEVPEWLAEMLLWFADLQPPETPTGETPATPAPVAPSPPAAVLTAVPNVAARAEDGKLAAMPAPAAPADVERKPMQTPALPVPAPAPTLPRTPARPTSVPQAMPAARAVPDTQNPLVRKTLLETGFDLSTGQIVDPARFEKWKQQNARPASANQAALTNESLLEVFRKSRLAIEGWLDDDTNRDRLMTASVDEIRKHVDIERVFRDCSGCGAEMQRKLQRHLEFMVENRRKYYRAIAAG